jgi:glycosyltransferase involved in cell wall biosynthesis
MPVRNGGATIRLAVESVLAQSYADLEIIISDNCSSDETEETCREVAAIDPRIRYVRQPQKLTATENFRYVFEQSIGEFFLWAAHDDLRSANYLEVLVLGAREWPDACIVFSDSVAFDDYQNYCSGTPVEFRCDTRGLEQRERHRAQAMSNCLHFYGLVNPKVLQRYPWKDSVGADHLLLHWLLCFGDFIYVPGATFYYYRPRVGRTIDEVALRTNYRRAGAFPIVRFAWVCASLVGSEDPGSLSFAGKVGRAWFFYRLASGGAKHTLYRVSPAWMKSSWSRMKRGVAGPEV